MYYEDYDEARLEMIGIVREFRKNNESYYEDKYHEELARAEKLEEENKELKAKCDILLTENGILHRASIEYKSSKAYKILKWAENLLSYRIRIVKEK